MDPPPVEEFNKSIWPTVLPLIRGANITRSPRWARDTWRIGVATGEVVVKASPRRLILAWSSPNTQGEGIDFELVTDPHHLEIEHVEIQSTEESTWPVHLHALLFHVAQVLNYSLRPLLVEPTPTVASLVVLSPRGQDRGEVRLNMERSEDRNPWPPFSIDDEPSLSRAITPKGFREMPRPQSDAMINARLSVPVSPPIPPSPSREEVTLPRWVWSSSLVIGDRKGPGCMAEGCHHAAIVMCHCRKAYYCSLDCQTQDWPRHQQGCSLKLKVS